MNQATKSSGMFRLQDHLRAILDSSTQMICHSTPTYISEP
jgi:hypothetical protein